MNLLYEIIDSIPIGLPLGNYMSQQFANLYLTKFDHWIKQDKKVAHYFRYMDDIVILGDNKDELRLLFGEIKEYLYKNLKLTIKSNHQIFPVTSRGIDFVGYVHYKNYTKLRKRIKKNFIKMIKTNNNQLSINSYRGWLSHCNSVNLQRKYL